LRQGLQCGRRPLKFLGVGPIGHHLFATASNTMQLAANEFILKTLVAGDCLEGPQSLASLALYWMCLEVEELGARKFATSCRDLPATRRSKGNCRKPE
jgi:hypothetical protein